MRVTVSLLIFLHAINLMPTSLGAVGFALVATVGLWRYNFAVSLAGISLAVFLSSYALASLYHGFFSLSAAVLFVILPLSMYFVGEYATLGKNRHSSVFHYGYLVVLSLAMYGLLSVGRTLLFEDIAAQLMGARIVYAAWSGVRMNATNIGAYLTGAISLAGLLVLPQRNRLGIGIRALTVFLVVTSGMALLYLGNRTGAVIMVASFLVLSAVYFGYSPGYKLEKLKAFALVTLTLLGVLFVLQQNLLGLGEGLADSTLSVRLMQQSVFEEVRFIAWGEALAGLTEHPLGGKEANISLNYVHNLWLDVGYVAGIVPLLLLTLFSVLALKDCLRLIKDKNAPIALKLLISGFYTSLFLNFAVEPVLEGVFVIFTMFCFMAGVLRKYVSSSRTRVYNEGA